MIDINIKRKLHGAGGDLILHFETVLQPGELVTLYGPTGAGKSSVLRMLAGLMQPDAGTIRVDEHLWYDAEKGVYVKPQSRDIGLVFQDYCLFPNMTVRGNLEYALDKKKNSDIVDELLEVAELTSLQDKRPHLLSGGQKQRVALTRALVRRPRLLLLDEPLSALDMEMRTKLQNFILMFHKQMNLTTILVTHDFGEVLRMSERMLVLENGSVKRDCHPRQFLHDDLEDQSSPEADS